MNHQFNHDFSMAFKHEENQLLPPFMIKQDYQIQNQKLIQKTQLKFEQVKTEVSDDMIQEQINPALSPRQHLLQQYNSSTRQIGGPQIAISQNMPPNIFNQIMNPGINLTKRKSNDNQDSLSTEKLSNIQSIDNERRKLLSNQQKSQKIAQQLDIPSFQSKIKSHRPSKTSTSFAYFNQEYFIDERDSRMKNNQNNRPTKQVENFDQLFEDINKKQNDASKLTPTAATVKSRLKLQQFGKEQFSEYQGLENHETENAQNLNLPSYNRLRTNNSGEQKQNPKVLSKQFSLWEVSLSEIENDLKSKDQIITPKSQQQSLLFKPQSERNKINKFFEVDLQPQKPMLNEITKLTRPFMDSSKSKEQFWVNENYEEDQEIQKNLELNYQKLSPNKNTAIGKNHHNQTPSKNYENENELSNQRSQQKNPEKIFSTKKNKYISENSLNLKNLINYAKQSSNKQPEIESSQQKDEYLQRERDHYDAQIINSNQQVPVPINQKNLHNNQIPIFDAPPQNKIIEQKQLEYNQNLQKQQLIVYVKSNDIGLLSNQMAPKPKDLFQLEETITIAQLYKNSLTGTELHEKLHIPSLQVFAVKQTVMDEYQYREIDLPELKIWKKTFQQAKNIMQIHDIISNSPEGHCSIIMDYFQGGSLNDMLKTFYCLNKKQIFDLSLRIADGLQEYLSLRQESYDYLSPSEIYFNHQGQAFLGVALKFRKKAGFKNEFVQATKNLIAYSTKMYRKIRSFIYLDTKQSNQYIDSSSTDGNLNKQIKPENPGWGQNLEVLTSENPGVSPAITPQNEFAIRNKQNSTVFTHHFQNKFKLGTNCQASSPIGCVENKNRPPLGKLNHNLISPRNSTSNEQIIDAAPGEQFESYYSSSQISKLIHKTRIANDDLSLVNSQLDPTHIKRLSLDDDSSLSQQLDFSIPNTPSSNGNYFLSKGEQKGQKLSSQLSENFSEQTSIVNSLISNQNHTNALISPRNQYLRLKTEESDGDSVILRPKSNTKNFSAKQISLPDIEIDLTYKTSIFSLGLLIAQCATGINLTQFAELIINQKLQTPLPQNTFLGEKNENDSELGDSKTLFDQDFQELQMNINSQTRIKRNLSFSEALEKQRAEGICCLFHFAIINLKRIGDRTQILFLKSFFDDQKNKSIQKLICYCLRMNEDARISPRDLNQDFISSLDDQERKNSQDNDPQRLPKSDINGLVTFEQLIKLDQKMKQDVENDCLRARESQLTFFCQTLKQVLPSCEKWASIDEKSKLLEEKQILLKQISHPQSELLKVLCLQFGLKVTVVNYHIKECLNDCFKILQKN